MIFFNDMLWSLVILSGCCDVTRSEQVSLSAEQTLTAVTSLIIEYRLVTLQALLALEGDRHLCYTGSYFWKTRCTSSIKAGLKPASLHLAGE